MNKKLIVLAERRERLVTRVMEQRFTLVQDIEPWRTPLAVADRSVAALRFSLHHPQWIIGGAILLVVLRPRRIGKWIWRTLMAWQFLDELESLPLNQAQARTKPAATIQAISSA